ncbi:MAG: universal stress protein [Bacteroidales bacterium]|nr:universal stress protein [Bacteroidales bacterium]
MEESSQIVVVPWDFTQVAENALAHAVKIAKTLNNEIRLLHIVDSGIKNAEEMKVRYQLQQIAELSATKYGTAISSDVVKGSIFTDIAEYVNDNDASLVVMGTHGIKGMQKLTGSWALKVIVKSKVPFIVVQDPPDDQEKYHDIVFPIDFKKENKEKIQMGIYMGKYFNSKIHIIVSSDTDQRLLQQTKGNLNFAIKYFMQNNVSFEIHELPKGDMAQQAIDFANENKYDLILIMTTKNISFADYVLGASEQYIIANSFKIPVCCVNPRASFAKTSQFMGGWSD